MRFRAFPERVGPRILLLERADKIGTSEHFSESCDEHAVYFEGDLNDVPCCHHDVISLQFSYNYTRV